MCVSVFLFVFRCYYDSIAFRWRLSRSDSLTPFYPFLLPQPAPPSPSLVALCVVVASTNFFTLRAVYLPRVCVCACVFVSVCQPQGE